MGPTTTFSDADDGKIAQTSVGGWIGITDKYWLAALIPDQKSSIASRFVHTLQDRRDKYQVDTLGEQQTVQPGATIEVSERLFAGAKEVRLLDAYEENLGIVNFDLAVDFGWFYFLTKPIFYVLEYFNRMIGNFGLAILLLTVLIKIAFFPLANKSYRAMSRLKKLQPEMMKIRDRFKDDRQRQKPGDDGALQEGKRQPGQRLLPHPDPDSGLLRALQGAVRLHRDAPTRPSSAGFRTCPPPTRSES